MVTSGTLLADTRSETVGGLVGLVMSTEFRYRSLNGR
jgi:hypothetical protein